MGLLNNNFKYIEIVYLMFNNNKIYAILYIQLINLIMVYLIMEIDILNIEYIVNYFINQRKLNYIRFYKY